MIMVVVMMVVEVVMARAVEAVINSQVVTAVEMIRMLGSNDIDMRGQQLKSSRATSHYADRRFIRIYQQVCRYRDDMR